MPHSKPHLAPDKYYIHHIQYPSLGEKKEEVIFNSILSAVSINKTVLCNNTGKKS